MSTELRESSLLQAQPSKLMCADMQIIDINMLYGNARLRDSQANIPPSGCTDKLFTIGITACCILTTRALASAAHIATEPGSEQLDTLGSEEHALGLLSARGIDASLLSFLWSPGCSVKYMRTST